MEAIPRLVLEKVEVVVGAALEAAGGLGHTRGNECQATVEMLMMISPGWGNYHRIPHDCMKQLVIQCMVPSLFAVTV